MTSNSTLNDNAKKLTSELSPISQLTDPSFEDHQVVRKNYPIQIQLDF